MTTGEDSLEDSLGLLTETKNSRYALSTDVVEASTTLSAWSAIGLIPNAATGHIIVPPAEFASAENYVKRPKARKEAVKWLTSITKWALQECLSPAITKEIIEEHLENFKHYICVESSTWDDFVHVFYAKHKIDGATQFMQWYNHQRSFGSISLFSYRELQRATNNFSRALKCAEGSIGVVFKGVEETSEQFIAVKRLKKTTDFSLDEVLHEVAVNHFIKRSLKDTDKLDIPLVALLGFAPYQEDPLLVFEFMPNGNLWQHLQGHYGKYLHSHPSDRLGIAIDVANALKHLHCNCESPIYHGDVKSTNILLGARFRAKLADFRTAKVLRWISETSSDLGNEVDSVAGDMGHSDDAEAVKSPGYVDPLYEQTGKLSDLTDVYNFGVVLLELATFMKAWDPDRSVKCLTDLVKDKMDSGNVSDIVSIKPDAHAGEAVATIKLMLLLGLDCCSFDMSLRPRIEEVEQTLLRLRDGLRSWDEGATPARQVDAALAAIGNSYRNLTLTR